MGAHIAFALEGRVQQGVKSGLDTGAPGAGITKLGRAGGTGGAIYASGTLRAQSIANVNGRIELTSVGGPVMVGAPGIFSDAGSPFTQGSIDVSGGAGETGGSVLIQGNGVFMVNDDPNPGNPTDPFSIGS